ncbi:uncharacterized protein LOC111043594 [Nilaparvata lugens]|uniref:uncharacterized protein LOC111043594 n=1 Tax=Nilaparvata lugens TaxID=108931 RepID=UPI00193D1596|nr:uncharacterized protein LOC111043594 [Nilaparvata lugens]
MISLLVYQFEEWIKEGSGQTSAHLLSVVESGRKMLRATCTVTCVALLACLGASSAFPTQENAITPEKSSSVLEDGLGTAYRMVQGCGGKDLMLCLKMRMLTYVDKAVRRSEDISLVDGVALVRSPSADNSRVLSGRALSEDELDASLPKDSESRDAQVESMLVDRVARFLESRTLQLKVPESSISDMKKSLEEARGKKKNKKLLLPLLLLLKMKAAALIPLALGALALLALKALIVGKLALVLSALIGLQKLLSSKSSSSSYEVVAHPHYEEHHGHYARAMQDPHQLAYRAYQPEQVKQD